MRINIFVTLAFLPAAAAAYYSFAPLDPLASFDAAREETVHAVRADLHLGYGSASGYFDGGGAFKSADRASTLFLGVAKVGWTFDKVWEADLVIPGANLHGRFGATDQFESGLGDIWLAGKGVWYTKEGGEFRLGPRLGFRFPTGKADLLSDENVAVDVAALGYWEVRGKHFRLDAQLGFRHDGDSDHFDKTPGLSLYFLADPALTIGRYDSKWVGGLSLGGYTGAGTVQTSLFWLGPRAQYIIDPNVRLEAGALFPVAGKSYQIGGYSYGVPRYITGYLGVQSVIPTTW